jgi:hypothetical protein
MSDLKPDRQRRDLHKSNLPVTSRKIGPVFIIQGLKPRIFDKLNKHSKKWAAELSSVLWSLRMMPSQATGFTPFFLVYGSEAMLLTDVEYRSPRLKVYNEQNNDVTRENALDQLEEAHDVALLHSARYQQSL